MTDHHRAVKSIRTEPSPQTRRGDTGSLREVRSPTSADHDLSRRCAEVLRTLEGLHVALEPGEVGRALVATRHLRHALEESRGAASFAPPLVLRLLRLEEGLSALHEQDEQDERLPRAGRACAEGRLALAGTVLDSLRACLDDLSRAAAAPGGGTAGPPPGR